MNGMYNRVEVGRGRPEGKSFMSQEALAEDYNMKPFLGMVR